MAQKDYVGRGRSTGTRRKKTSNGRSGKRRGNNSAVSKFMVALAVAVLVTFAGGLWFIAHHKKEDALVIPNHKTPGNGLPPKPEERWRYIKELENSQVTVPSPTEPSAGGFIHPQTQLTNEQRQLLDQMQADMKQQPTQLNEVPWNEQTPVQRQQTLQRQRLQNQLEMQSRLPVQSLQPRPTQPTPRTPQPQTTAKQPESATEKVKSPRWMLQCGSFKSVGQAESTRAKLAFEGFESRITSGSGWNRVVIGPYNSRTGVDSALQTLRGSGHTNCIPIAIGG
ncbi:cell division protein FtsN [Izhakiella capsodis]|uniref:Cell division protein FtsN n=1 Tax=Izhakiella capsodis TaxID=1367852 RepID=A0A1I5AC14_9GAMM|nr:cell division protein FtsN [Izhakiella capsodis]SFN60004.1 cell division protein FtsN [Izhakiella capsodis]